ncbi:uncharacterized protein LOC118200011 [Stegodyphus dumicola]|uniref:uncharacterized protein LOC118200011 n=1 Tax=Stegodyphus dumicola TaxID=202533 RepID=UPI0015B1744B|nr:uncharacterized protein LOC118200011 [Stegodyphus dumicola]
MILYGCPIWMQGTVRQRQKLQQIQRVALLKITKAFTTTSTAALQILAGILPLDLKAEEERLTYRLLHFKESAIENGLTILEESALEPHIRTTASHPASSVDIKWDKLPPLNADLEIFTDGSKTDSKVGAAFVVFHNAQEIHQEQYRLSDHATVYQAESLALKQAALWISSSDSISHSIYTDSLSILQGLNRIGSQPLHVSSLKEILSTLAYTKNISLHWVRGHHGTQGNERADALAKAATELQQITKETPVSLITAKNRIHGHFMSIWHTR